MMQNIGLTTPELIDSVYKHLLERPAEPGALNLSMPIIDFILNVATSEERNCLVEYKINAQKNTI